MQTLRFCGFWSALIGIIVVIIGDPSEQWTGFVWWASVAVMFVIGSTGTLLTRYLCNRTPGSPTRIFVIQSADIEANTEPVDVEARAMTPPKARP